MKVVRQGANAIPVFVFTYPDFLDKTLYSAKRYINVTIQGAEDSLFFPAKYTVPAADSGGIGAMSVDRNDCTDGAEANDAPNLLSGRTSKIRSEDMAELHRQYISIDDDNNPALDIAPIQGETTTGTGKWRREGIICPRKAGKLQNYFASFRHYLHDSVLRMSLLQLLLIMFPEGYLE